MARKNCPWLLTEKQHEILAALLDELVPEGTHSDAEVAWQVSMACVSRLEAALLAKEYDEADDWRHITQARASVGFRPDIRHFVNDRDGRASVDVVVTDWDGKPLTKRVLVALNRAVAEIGADGKPTGAQQTTYILTVPRPIFDAAVDRVLTMADGYSDLGRGLLRYREIWDLHPNAVNAYEACIEAGIDPLTLEIKEDGSGQS